mmetsp:Transcript_19291/g.56919  ORF Transcript_19291/g.56919 Transcript_19291/m.56919 type:complete len:232 (-) Transcript_19291:958-1653(-)
MNSARARGPRGQTVAEELGRGSASGRRWGWGRQHTTCFDVDRDRRAALTGPRPVGRALSAAGRRGPDYAAASFFFFFFFSPSSSPSPSRFFFFFSPLSFFSFLTLASSPPSAPPAAAAAAGSRGGTYPGRHSGGVSSFGLPCLSSLPSAMSAFFCSAFGPRPQRRGYVSRSMMTRLILATTPWSQCAMSEVVICAMPTATASPLVVIRTTSSFTSMSLAKRSSPGSISLAP